MAVECSYAAFQSFRREPPKTRAQKLQKWDSLIRNHKDDLATILTFENGKPLKESVAQIEYSLTFT